MVLQKKIYSVNSASGNTLTIGNVDNIDVRVFASWVQESSGNVNVDNNILNINGDVSTANNIIAAYAKQTDTNATDVSVTCNNNTMNITGDVTATNTAEIIASEASSYCNAIASGNTLNISGDVNSDKISAAAVSADVKADAINNHAVVSGDVLLTGNLYASHSTSKVDAIVNNNSVTLQRGAKVEGNVVAGHNNNYGGQMFNGRTEVTNNTVTIEDNAVVNSVYGAYAVGNSLNNSIIVNENTVNISDKVIANAVGTNNDKNAFLSYSDFESTYGVYGAYAVSKSDDKDASEASASAILSGNIVNISGGTVNGNVYGAYAIAGNYFGIADLDAQANGNKVNLSGGTITGDVYGGYSIEITGEVGYPVEIEASTASNNEVNISGTVDVEDASLFGNNDDDGITGSTGNTLNIGDGWSGKIKSAQNFNIVNFGKGSAVTVTEGMKLGAGATINLADGDDYIGDGNWAIDGTLTVNSDEATLTIGNIKAATYNIASEYNDDTIWKLDNDLMNVKEWNTDGQLQVTVEAKSASDIATKLETSESTGSFVKDIIDGGNNEATEFLSNLMGSDITNEARNETLNAVQKMGEEVGQSATAANIVKNVTGVTNDRLSFNCGHSAPHKGGHGVGLFEEGSGADIWVEYVHGKDEVEDMPSTAGATSYEGQYNGIVMGVDFKKVGKFQSGIAFNYGEGDTNSVGSATRTHSDYDFWGVGYYGNIHNDDSNVIFDINYAQTDSDVTQSNPATTLEASPETTTWSAGVKLEKLYQNENVQIVPYTGLRYMSIDSDDYATKGKGFMYSMERQDIWLLPLGVSIRQEVTNDNGWTVSPRVDLSYIWAFGDTNSNMEVKSGNGITPIGYDVMDDGSFLGLVGIEAHKGQWGYGVAYSYQKGDHSESKKWYVDVNYSF